MDELQSLFHGFGIALTVPNLGYMLIGITLGVLIGVLPGLGGANGIAILLPLTFSMNPTSAIIMLSCIYWGALFGGAITSILFNIPGEPWSVATTFDGYPMARDGRPTTALATAFGSAAFGALVGSMIVGLFVELSTLWLPSDLKYVGALVVLILVLLLRPQGILGRKERIG